MTSIRDYSYHSPLDVHYLRMCLIKILLGKILWDKKLVKKKEYIIFQYVIICLIKNFVSKTQLDKTVAKEKRVHNILFLLSCGQLSLRR